MCVFVNSKNFFSCCEIQTEFKLLQISLYWWLVRSWPAEKEDLELRTEILSEAKLGGTVSVAVVAITRLTCELKDTCRAHSSHTEPAALSFDFGVTVLHWGSPQRWFYSCLCTDLWQWRASVSQKFSDNLREVRESRKRFSFKQDSESFIFSHCAQIPLMPKREWKSYKRKKDAVDLSYIEKNIEAFIAYSYTWMGVILRT